MNPFGLMTHLVIIQIVYIMHFIYLENKISCCEEEKRSKITSFLPNGAHLKAKSLVLVTCNLM